MGSPKYSILSQDSIHRKDNEPQIIMLTRWISVFLMLFILKIKYVDMIFHSGISVVIN